MKTTTANNVANFFLAKGAQAGDEISNLKLQKLLYYAQGFHLAYFNASLFNDSIEAWRHGPVCPDVYHKYKRFESSPIPFAGREPIFKGEQLELLEEVYEVFGQFSAWKLRNMTHAEKPWVDNEEKASVITKRELKSYFKTRLA